MVKNFIGFADRQKKSKFSREFAPVCGAAKKSKFLQKFICILRTRKFSGNLNAKTDKGLVPAHGTSWVYKNPRSELGSVDRHVVCRVPRAVARRRPGRPDRRRSPVGGAAGRKKNETHKGKSCYFLYMPGRFFSDTKNLSKNQTLNPCQIFDCLFYLHYCLFYPHYCLFVLTIEFRPYHEKMRRRTATTDQEKGAKRRRLTSQPLITAVLRPADPPAATKACARVPSSPFTLATLARRSAAPPSDQGELDALTDAVDSGVIPLLLPALSMLPAYIETGHDPSKRDLQFMFNDRSPTVRPGERILSALDMNILHPFRNSPGAIAELLLLPRAAPFLLSPHLAPDLANIVCSYLEPVVCYDPMPAGGLADNVHNQNAAGNALPPRYFPLHEHAYWTMVDSEEARALHGDIVFKEAAAAGVLRHCSSWEITENEWVLLHLVDPDQVEAQRDLLDRYRRMYWRFIELRLNAGLKAVFEHVAHRLNSFFAIPQGPPPSNKWPFLVSMPY